MVKKFFLGDIIFCRDGYVFKVTKLVPFDVERITLWQGIKAVFQIHFWTYLP